MEVRWTWGMDVGFWTLGKGAGWLTTGGKDSGGKDIMDKGNGWTVDTVEYRPVSVAVPAG